MITEAQCIVGQHARYFCFLNNRQPKLGLINCPAQDDCMFVDIPDVVQPWTSNAILYVLCWESATMVHNVVSHKNRSAAWDLCKQECSDLDFSGLFHEYMWEGVFYVVTLRPKARA